LQNGDTFKEKSSNFYRKTAKARAGIFLRGRIFAFSLSYLRSTYQVDKTPELFHFFENFSAK